jgi:hypothetical protein
MRVSKTAIDLTILFQRKIKDHILIGYNSTAVTRKIVGE